MKKLLFLISFLFVIASVSGQINYADSSVQVVAYWDKNEVQNYRITNTDLRTKDEVVTKNDSIVFDMKLTVVDSTATSYTIEAQYMNHQVFNNNVKQDTPWITEGLKVIYKTDELGVISEVVNWEEIGRAINNATDKLIAHYEEKNSLNKEALDVVKATLLQTFTTKEAIENISIQEIQQLHMFHGMNYKQGEDIVTQLELPNVFDPQNPFMSDASFILSQIDEEESFCVLTSIQSIPKDQLISSLLKYFKGIQKQMGKESNLDAFGNMELENTTQVVSSIHDSGWVLYSEMTKVVSSLGNKVVKTCKIQLQ